ncbi:MAG: hypothetical protein Phog2KO_29470 [Phototrophicaceae bacterium]
MKQKIYLALIAVLLMTIGFVTNAQDISPTAVPSDADDIAISYPPPVWVISDSVEIIGTADVLDMSNYFIEYHEIRFDAEDDSDVELWFPATLPGSRALRNDVLGTWNTTTVRDGLYAIRLVINLTDGTQQIFEVSPIRVENDPQDGIAGLSLSEPTSPLQATPTNLPGGGGERPTLAPTPTSITSSNPVVTALVDANIRSGDNTNYPRVDSLLEGEQAEVLGISSTGTGWFYIQAPSGRRGFIASSTVDFNGNIATLSFINPPATPTPLPTATPVTTANLQVTGISLTPVTPNCNETFQININVNNSGTGATSASGTLTVIDRNNRTGTTTASTIGGFPIIESNGNFVVVANLTVDTFFNETHTIVVTVDSNGAIPETNEGDNTSSISYVLEQASCG